MFWAASDVGWVVGHSYIVYAPLLHGAPPILYEGKPVGTPDAGAFWRVIAEHKVAALFTAPTAFRAIKQGRPGRQVHPASTTCRTSARCSWPASAPTRDTCTGPSSMLKVPVIDHWWQTETGWAIAANCVGLGMLPVKPGSPTVPMPGYDVAGPRRRRQAGAARHDRRASCVKLPLPPGCLPTLWHNDERFREVLPRRLPRLLHDRRRRLHGRGRLPLHHGPHRRHHQRRRPPALDRRHGGGAGRAPGRRRVRGDRRRRRAQGPGAAGLRGAEGRRRPRRRPRSRRRCVALVRDEIGPVAAFKTRDRGDAPAQDPLGQDPARHHEEDRRRRSSRCRPPSTIRRSSTRSARRWQARGSERLDSGRQAFTLRSGATTFCRGAMSRGPAPAARRAGRGTPAAAPRR